MMIFAIVTVLLGFIIRWFNSKIDESNESSTENTVDTNSTEEQACDTPSQFEQCRAILRELGFRIRGDENVMQFTFEGSTMLLCLIEEQNSLSIIVPKVWSVSDSDELTLHRLANKVNKALCHAKAYISDDYLRLSSHHYIEHDEVISTIVIREMIEALGYAASLIEELHNEIKVGSIN